MFKIVSNGNAHDWVCRITFVDYWYFIICGIWHLRSSSVGEIFWTVPQLSQGSPHPKISSPKSAEDVQDKSLPCPGHVLDLSIVLGFQVKCEISTLSWVPMWSNVHDTGTGIDILSNCCRSLGRYMDHVWHTWQTIQIRGSASPQTSPQTYSYIIQVFRPKCQVGIYTIFLGDGVWSKEDNIGWNVSYPNTTQVFDGVYAMFDRSGESKGGANIIFNHTPHPT